MNATNKKPIKKSAPSKTRIASQKLFADDPPCEAGKNRLPPKITEALAIGILEEALRQGKIDAKGKDPQVLRPLFVEYLRGALDHKGVRILLRTDHTDNLFREARRFSRSDREEFAILFYATWFEHWANRVIRSLAMKAHFNDDDIIQMIKETPIRGKLGWLLRLFGLPPIRPTHTRRILFLIELRNSFVHYKWKGQDVDDDQEERKTRELLEAIDSSVRYLKRYEQINVLSHTRRKIKRIFNVKVTSPEHV